MSEAEQLERAITTIEAQRSILGDAVVDAALAPMREKLAGLRQPAAEQRKLVTVLFADLVNYTSMSEKMDPEDVREIVNAYFQRWAPIIEQQEGVVEKFIGDAVMAVFGLQTAREDDPERAIRAALAMRVELEALNGELEKTFGLRLAQRVGIHTGPVIVSIYSEKQLRADGQDFSVVGDTVNLTSRLQSAAPTGGILISLDTYRHVRGLFLVQALTPIQVKGKNEPIQAYLVNGAKPRAFRVGTRGVEGVETPMIGRDAELKRLQDALYAAMDNRGCQFLTLVGEAGIGKSRLIEEFDNWAELIPETMYYFKGRAHPAMQNQPYSILRDMFSFRLGIQTSDTPDIVRQKLEAGNLAPEQARWIGGLMGLEFGDSPYPAGQEADARQLRDRALAALQEYFAGMSAKNPVILLLEDLHWADDSSLDAVETLLSMLAEARFVVIGTARPSLLERRPSWGERQPVHQFIDLHPLSSRDSRILVEEILRKVDKLPEALRELVVTSAEGNPFYMEELIKMLVEDGVIARDGERWRVVQADVAKIRVPPTLTGVLQTRFDSLRPPERLLLQRASVIGRTFWDQAVAALERREPDAPAGPEFPWDAGTAAEIIGMLRSLRSREMVFPHDNSAFDNTTEYAFIHALLRDVTYESVLKRDRRVYHALVAHWLEQVTRRSQRADEYAALIAEHYDRAGERDRARQWYVQAAKGATETYANAEAVRLLSRALDLTPEDELVARLDLLLERFKLLNIQADRAAQQKDLLAMDEITRGLLEKGRDAHRRVLYLIQHAAYSEVTGDYPTAIRQAQQAVDLAHAAKDIQGEAEACIRVGTAYWRMSRNAEARPPLERALQLGREAGLPVVEADALRQLGIVSQTEGDFAAARQYLESALPIIRQAGEKRREGFIMNSLGVFALERGDYARAKDFFAQSLRIKREIGDRFGENLTLNNLAIVVYRLGDYPAAQKYFENCLRLAREFNDQEGIAGTLGGLGGIDLLLGNPERALQRREQAATLYQSTGDREGEGGERISQAFLFNNLEKYDAALQYAEMGLRLATESEMPAYQVFALMEAGRALVGLGRLDEAEAANLEARRITEQIGLEDHKLDLLAGLVELHLARGDAASARDVARDLLSHLDPAPAETGGETNPLVIGSDDPARIFLACWDALRQDPNPRIREQVQGLPGTAMSILEERAAKLDEAALAQAYRSSLPSHRRLLEFFGKPGIFRAGEKSEA